MIKFAKWVVARLLNVFILTHYQDISERPTTIITQQGYFTLIHTGETLLAHWGCVGLLGGADGGWVLADPAFVPQHRSLLLHLVQDLLALQLRLGLGLLSHPVPHNTACHCTQRGEIHLRNWQTNHHWWRNWRRNKIVMMMLIRFFPSLDLTFLLLSAMKLWKQAERNYPAINELIVFAACNFLVGRTIDLPNDC